MVAVDGKSILHATDQRYFSIGPGQPFLDALAHHLLAYQGKDPLALADVQVYLPTRRAIRTLSDRLTLLADHKVSILPQIRAIGSMEADDDFDDLAMEVDGDLLALPPAMSSMERVLLLAQFVARKNKAFAGEENWPAALMAARELAKLLDSLYTEEIDLSTLEDRLQIDQTLADHWQVSREFLTIITEAWPKLLAEKDMMDPAARRIALIRQTIRRWQKNPPTEPIILAGTTGSTPAVADLMETITSLPRGYVIFPGTDLTLDEAAWQAIDDPHPQSGLKALFARLGLPRCGIGSLPKLPPTAKQIASNSKDARQHLLSLALRPAERTDDWLDQVAGISTDDAQNAVHGLTLVEAADEENEADIIALMIRQTLDEAAAGSAATATATVMLVTPDRTLARRVSMKLRRWSIRADDSGGVPLANTPAGTFLRLVARWLCAPSDPLALMAVLQHPLCAPRGGRAAMARLDRCLRGLAPTGGFDDLRTRVLADAGANGEMIAPLLDWLGAALANWYPGRDGLCAADMIDQHLATASVLTTGQSGDTPLWTREDGRAAADCADQIRTMAPYLRAAGIADYPGLFTQLMAGIAVRPAYQTHPRIAILGPLEARLHSADHVILAGLNEGVWPGEATTDGFLSRTMRAAAGLPAPERRTGLAAHDFAQLAAHPRVTLTRAKRGNNAPTTMSRWLVRLRNLVGALTREEPGAPLPIDRSTHWRNLSAQLHTAQSAAHMPAIAPPQPRPPVTARPTEFFVTRIEDWLRDPYGFYARAILNLRPLDPLNDPFSARHLGIIMHDAFEAYAKQLPHDANSDRALLHRLFMAAFEKKRLPARTQALWLPAFRRSLDWFAAWHRARLDEGTPVVLEGEGTWPFEIGDKRFEVRARADRIDLYTSPYTDDCKALAIYDYKTGILKTLNQDAKFSPQLALTALIAQHGGFGAMGTNTIDRLANIKTFNRSKDDIGFGPKDTTILEGGDAYAAMVEAEEQLRALITIFEEETTPYLSQPRPEYANRFGTYDHLARRREWMSDDDQTNGEG
ncbi:MAG: double-strand break repair protein AddB [Pseudomonadota bacterium]